MVKFVDYFVDKEGSSSSNSSCSGSDDSDDEGDDWMEELNRKKNHPYRLHEELWFNDPGEVSLLDVKVKCILLTRIVFWI